MPGEKQMKFEAVADLKQKSHAVVRCCTLLDVASSSYYHWSTRGVSRRQERSEGLEQKIVQLFHASKKNYGSPRIYQSLKAQGERVGENTVARIMKNAEINATKKKSFRPKTTINDPKDQKSARVFQIENYRVKKENDVWGSDLTYLPLKTGFCYLVVVLDFFNREIKGWDLSDTMRADGTHRAILNAVKSIPGSLKGTVFHSDQGVQYCSSTVRDKLALLEMTQSMSRRGNCYDNAFVESFFHSLKNELEKQTFGNIEEAKRAIFEYINWYNRERLHSSLGYLSPIEYSKSIGHAA